MTEAKEIEWRNDPVLFEAVMAHNIEDPLFVHTNMQASLCICRRGQQHAALTMTTVNSGSEGWHRRDSGRGDICPNCGSLMQPTGSCMTCPTCAYSGGCG